MRRFLPVFAGFLSAGIFVLPQAASADPVTISIDAGADTYVRNGADNTNEGGAAFLRIQQSGNNRALVHFSQVELQGPLRGRNLISATLKADIVHNGNNWGSTGRTVDAHRMRQGWSEGNGKVAGISPSDRGDGPGATWNCAIDANISNQAKDCTANTAWNMGGSGERPWELVPTGTALIQNQQSGTVSWDVTADVQAFLDGSVPNHGWLLRKTNEGQSGLVEFASRESGNPPSLVLVVENAISPEASAVIDADTGGCIEVEDPLSPIAGTGICIPPGALDEDTEIFIRVRNEDIVPDTEAFDWTPIGPPVEFGPAGLLFDIPAEVHLRFSMMDRFRFGGTDAEIHLLGQESLGDTPFLVTSFDIDEENELITFDTGSFTTFQPFIFFTTAGRPGAFAVGDLNGDGIQDMVVGSGGAVIGDADGRITVYLGNDADNDSKGDGTFSSSEYLLSVLPVQRTGPVTGVNIADYTGDGIPDIAVYYNSILSTPDSHKVLIRIFKGQDSNNDGFGDGTFERITNCGGTPYYLTGDCGIGGYANMSAQMETADMNNDGKPDLVMLMTNQSPVVYCGMCSPRIHMYVMYNVGTAARLFAAPVRLDRSSTDTSGALYGWLSQIRIADFNGDSRPDIAAISVPNRSILEIYRNTGGRVDLAWTQPLCLAPFVGNTCPSGPFVGSPANFDEYAPLDILTTGGIFRGNGDISFQPLENHSGLTISPFYESVSATGHINPDMILDVVIGKKPITVQTNPYRYINALSVFMGNESSTSPGMGDASFHFDIDITYGSNFNRKDIRIADFNNDGCNDIVLLNDRNAPAAFLLTLNGSTGCAFDVQITVFEADPDIVAPGDTSTLSWGTINADACEILAGSVLLHVLDSGELAAGSFDVSPNATTTYTLTCQGHNGPVSATATVTIPVPVITAINHACVLPGGFMSMEILGNNFQGPPLGLYFNGTPVIDDLDSLPALIEITSGSRIYINISPTTLLRNTLFLTLPVPVEVSISNTPYGAGTPFVSVFPDPLVACPGILFNDEIAYTTTSGGEGTTLIRGDYLGVNSIDDVIIFDALTSSYWIFQGDDSDNNGIHDGTFTHVFTGDSGVGLIRFATSGLLNSDAFLDFIVIGNASDSMSIILSDGLGSFSINQIIDFPSGSGPIAAAVIDYDMDDTINSIVVSMYNSNQIHNFIANVSGIFEYHSIQPVVDVGANPQFILATEHNTDSYLDYSAPFDANIDGIADLITVNYGDGSVSILLGCGAVIPPLECLPENSIGTFAPPKYYVISSNGGTIFPFTTGIGIRSATAGDFTGDGFVDIAVIDYTDSGSTIHTLLGSGDGEFIIGPQSAVLSYLSGGTGISPSGSGAFIHSGYFNNDSILDLVVSGGGTFNPSIIMIGQETNGIPDASFVPVESLLSSGTAYNVSTSDINFDGIWDIYFSTIGNHQLSVFISK